jgi:hypothetical protein
MPEASVNMARAFIRVWRKPDSLNIILEILT